VVTIELLQRGEDELQRGEDELQRGEDELLLQRGAQCP
jgi:hypothetical protein